MASLPLYFDLQFFANDGSVAASHLLYTYEDGTTTPKATYTDGTGSTPNTNPISLNSAGRCALWLGSGSYSFELRTSSGVLVKRYDGIDSYSSTLQDLSDYASATKGAGMTGFSPMVIYPAKTVGAKLAERVSLFDFMTSAQIADVRARTLAQDVTSAVQDAIDYAEANGVELYAPAGDYLLSAQLNIDAPGVRLKGAGTGTTWDDLDNQATRFVGSHTTGAVIRIWKESCALTDIVIDSTSARQAAARNTTAANYNAGVRVEGDDVVAPEGDVFATQLDRVYVRNQPNDGFILIGRCYGSLVSDCSARDNYGHGFCVDAGSRTGRTNQTVPGLVTFLNGHATYNWGHGLAAGNPADDSSVLLPSFRILLLNFETDHNEVDPALRYVDYDVYLRGDNNKAINCAFNGVDRSNVSAVHGGLAVAGREPVAQNCRYLSCSWAARVVNYSAPSTATIGAVFDGMSVRNSASSIAVKIDSGATYTKVRIKDTTSLVAATDTSNVGDDVEYADIHTRHGSLNMSDYRSGRNLVVNDDQSVTMEFDATSYGVLVISGPTSASRPSLVAFRVGGSNFCNVLAGTATATTGVLTGTTGGAGALTISTHTDNKLYIENRTGAQRVYRLAFFAVDGGRLLPGQ